jgi:hypothetical protein
MHTMHIAPSSTQSAIMWRATDGLMITVDLALPAGEPIRNRPDVKYYCYVDALAASTRRPGPRKRYT